MLLILMACSNPYRANFNTTMDRIPDWAQDRLAPPPEKPDVQTTNDLREDNMKLFERGYLMVGYSKFDGKLIRPEMAVAQGQKIGADIVLLQRRFDKTITETVALTRWTPMETTEIIEKTSYTDFDETTNSSTIKQVESRVEIRTGGDPETYYVPRDVEYYEHSATYWRKLDRPIFGVLVKSISDKLKNKLETNRGLQVRGVIIDSPAYQTDILKNDVILELNGKPVPSVGRFYEKINELAGTQIELLILRKGKKMTIKVPLNS